MVLGLKLRIAFVGKTYKIPMLTSGLLLSKPSFVSKVKYAAGAQVVKTTNVISEHYQKGILNDSDIVIKNGRISQLSDIDTQTLKKHRAFALCGRR